MSRRRSMTMNSFHDYMSNELADDVSELLYTTSRQWFDPMEYEGTLRAAVWAALRNTVPNTWQVEAEVRYPPNDSLSPDNQRADVIVWNHKHEAIIIEIKPTMKRIKYDIAKIQRHLDLKSSSVEHGYVVFGFEDADEDFESGAGWFEKDVYCIGINWFFN